MAAVTGSHETVGLKANAVNLWGDFVVSIVLYTFETRPISIEILSSLRMTETGVAAAYGVLLALLSAVVFLVWGARSTDDARARPPG